MQANNDHEHTGITYSLNGPEIRHWASCDGVARGIGNVDEGAGWALATQPRAFFVGDGTSRPMAPPRSARGYSWINTPRAKRIHLEEAIGLVTLTTTLAYFEGCIAFRYPSGCVKAQAASNFTTNARLSAMRSLRFTSFFGVVSQPQPIVKGIAILM